jgi:hypothetical protein
MRNLGFQRWWMITGYRKPRLTVDYGGGGGGGRRRRRSHSCHRHL